jgi:hypothetical protein
MLMRVVLRYFLATLFLKIFMTIVVSAQVDTSNIGQEFWVGYGHHQFMETGLNNQNMVLYLSAGSQPATVTITLDSSHALPASWWSKTYAIPANTVIVTDIIP